MNGWSKNRERERRRIYNVCLFRSLLSKMKGMKYRDGCDHKILCVWPANQTFQEDMLVRELEGRIKLRAM